MPGFQTAVGVNPAPGIDGGWCSANPRGSMLAGPGAFTAGPQGVAIGRFGFVNAAGQVFNAAPVGWIRCGFIQRDQPVLITPWLAPFGVTVQAGLGLTLFDSGDVWMRFLNGASIGQQVFASYADGTALAAAPGATIPGGSVTASAGAAFTGAIAAGTGILTASAVTGVIGIGGVISGTGVPAGTTITAFLSGTNGGAGTYQTSTTTAVASTAMTEATSVLTVTAVGSGALYQGEPLSGTGVTPGTTLGAPATGTTNGAGSYGLSSPQYFASTTVTAQGAFPTRWFVDSLAAAAGAQNPLGDLAMTSTRG